jgi:C-terminal processing protease CtpA/Prc
MYEIHLMKSTFFRHRLVPAAIFVVIAASCGCAGAASRWDGTVDAAFSYRTAERQTIVRGVLPQSFAERAGLQLNDIIVAVDGVDITEATADEVIAAMRGPTGSVARLAISRGGAVVEVAVERIPRAEKEKRETASRPK